MKKIKIWIAGFGNEHREDDAAGVIIAGRLFDFLGRLPDTEVSLCMEHQLLPELAEELNADLAVFCDAAAFREGEFPACEFPASEFSIREFSTRENSIRELSTRELSTREFSIREISSNPRLAGFNIHSMGPEWLLALAEQIGTSPRRALLVTVQGERFDFSDTPTPACLERVAKAEEAFKKYWSSSLRDELA